MGETVSGGNATKRQLVEVPRCQKKPAFHFWFKILLLICLIFLVLGLAMSDNALSWWHRFQLQGDYRWFLNSNHSVHIPFYGVHPKHKVVQNEIHKTTEPPPVRAKGIQYHQAYPRNYQFIMGNTEVCKKETPFLVLMVPVAPNNVAARDAVRQTWAKNSTVQGELVLTLFMLGLSGGDDAEKLKQENSLHHDLIQSDFLDTYLNLTIKTMVIMDWLATYCPTAPYAMKIDSDMFLNIDNLVIMLQKPGIPKLNYLTGMLMWNRPVIRSKESKWYVPEEMYPDPQYPTYTLGMGYVFSNDLPERFVEVSKSIKPFNIEDAYIGMCMKKLGLSPTSPPDPSQFKAYNTNYNRCEYSKIITYILGSAEELVNYWTDLKKPGKAC
ncbi:beta-1,3-galactosyltransferase 1-like [Odontesthes bonariensis]|uniref:beta-1,3-galactosyltransferase 1-like n=1 Tax=Odontesthes bonariensis TaxID=219752 RepID=UPI003F584377